MHASRHGTLLTAAAVTLGGVLAALAGEPPTLDPARATFSRLSALTGTWKGKSTKGWVGTEEIRLIAGGSVLQSTFSFDDDPAGQNAMLTTYQLDGDALLLTHYCEAKNAPRLVATSFENGGERVRFTFRDGVNLPSRDHGHMDSMLLEFGDARHYRSQWSWYQNGKESWMEDVSWERVR